MARGVEDIGALDMSKYFDTNYHYLMPELNGSSSPNANFGPFLDKVAACLEPLLHLSFVDMPLRGVSAHANPPAMCFMS